MTEDLKQKLSEAFDAGKEFYPTVNDLKIPFHLVATAHHFWKKWEEETAKESEEAVIH